MKKLLIFLLSACFAVLLARVSIPQTLAAFNGYVNYHNCDCAPEHNVWVRKAGEPGDYHRVKCSGTRPGYNTQQYYYTAGWYYISVVHLDGTGCDVSYVQYVYYSGTGEMQVDLQVFGPQGGGNSPEPDPGP
jgi:hypothetical protein